MSFCDKIESALGHRAGLYNCHGDHIEGIDLGFIYVEDIGYNDGKTYIRSGNYIICVESVLAQDTCAVAKLLCEFIVEKETAEFLQPLDYILKNDVSKESIKGKYAGNTVFLIKSSFAALDILKSIYYNCEVNIVEDTNGIYLVKEVDDPELEAESIIEGISEEKGIKSIIGCGRVIGGSYTVKDSAAHANTAIELALNLGKNEGFYHIDKMLIYGMLFSLDEKTIEYYMNGGYDGFIDVVRDKELLSTAEVLFKCHLNISEAARRLYLHRNTLLYRIEKIKNYTGLDIKKFEEAVIFRTVTAIYKFKGK